MFHSAALGRDRLLVHGHGAEADRKGPASGAPSPSLGKGDVLHEFQEHFAQLGIL